MSPARTHSPGANWEAPRLLSSAGCTPVVAYDEHGTAYAAWVEPAFDTTTTSASAANATSIDVASTAGISPGVDVAIEPVTSSTGERATVVGSETGFVAGAEHVVALEECRPKVAFDRVCRGDRKPRPAPATEVGQGVAHPRQGRHLSRPPSSPRR